MIQLIRNKLLLRILGAALFSLLVMGGTQSFFTYWSISKLNRTNQIRESSRKIQLFIEEMRLAQAQLEQFGRMQPEFYMEGTSTYLRQHENIFTNLKAELRVLHLIADEASGYVELKELEQSLNRYQAEFNDLVFLFRKQGFKDWGLTGHWREQAHLIESTLKSQNDHLLLNTLLTMRRHEKDFMLRQQDKYVAEFRKTAELLRKQLNRFEPERRHILLNALSIYVDDFLQYERNLREIGFDENDGLRQVVLRLNLNMVDQAGKIKENAERKVFETIHWQRVFTVVSFIFSLLLGISIFIPLTVSISSPLRRLLKSVVEYNTDKTTRIEVIRGTRDIQDLSEAFQSLTDRLYEEGRRTRAILDSIPDAVITIKVNGVIQTVNPAFCSYFEVDEKEVVGASIWDFLQSEEGQKDMISLQHRLEQQPKGIKEWGLFGISKNNKKFPVYFSWKRYVTGNNRFYTCLISDITDRKAVEEELTKARFAAEAASRAKSDFLANMSHEIRTPLNSVIGFSELLAERLEAETRHEYLEPIQTSSKNLLLLINNILDISKIEAGRFELNYTPVDLKKIVREMSSVYKLNTQKKGIEFIVEIDPQIPGLLIFDEVRFRQILMNLIGNAVKFTEKGRIKIELKGKTLGADPRKIDLELMVSDTGIGFPMEFRERIFEAFFQQDSSQNRRFGGTGLGLAITKHIIDLVQGRISVESEVGKGSLFTINLPRVEIVRLKSDTAVDVTSLTLNIPDLSNRIILLAEDIDLNRKLILKILEPTRVRLIEAYNGSQAVELAREYRPDLILMDIQMPEVDGYEAAQIILKENELSGIPIIALTANAFEQDKLQAMKFGFKAYLTKPVSRTELFDVLNTFISAAV